MKPEISGIARAPENRPCVSEGHREKLVQAEVIAMWKTHLNRIYITQVFVSMCISKDVDANNLAFFLLYENSLHFFS